MFATQRPRYQPHHYHLIMLRTPLPSLLPLAYALLPLGPLHLPPCHLHRRLVCQILLQLPLRTLRYLHPQPMSRSKVCRQNSKSTFPTDASPLPDPSSHPLSEHNAGVPHSQTVATVDVAMSSLDPGQQGQPCWVVSPFTKPNSLFADQQYLQVNPL